MIEIRHEKMGNTASTQEAYNRLYLEEGILLRDSFYLWLISLLEPQPGYMLLDISCGQGRLVTLSRRKGLTSIGMDFAHEAVKRALAETQRASWAVADGERLPLQDASLDYVTHIGSLEHYQDPDSGIQEIARILKPTGTACILLPNTYSLFGNIMHVWKTGHVFDDNQPLQRYNTPKGWNELLITNGLRTVKTFKYEREWPRTWTDLRWYLTHPTKLARLLVSWLVPHNLANCIVYICQRDSSET